MTSDTPAMDEKGLKAAMREYARWSEGGSFRAGKPSEWHVVRENDDGTFTCEGVYHLSSDEMRAALEVKSMTAAIAAYLAATARDGGVTLTIKAGCYYLTRDGRTVGPMAWDPVVSVWRDKPDFIRNTGDYWHLNGSRFGHCEDGLDLVAPATLPASCASLKAVPEVEVVAWRTAAKTALDDVVHALMVLPVPIDGRGKRAWSSLCEAQETLEALLATPQPAPDAEVKP